ncbi:MAG: response regulator [Deltaproteobacteria bacterium]|nr:response regulator [Deltaproteobacteria bacterium]
MGKGSGEKRQLGRIMLQQKLVTQDELNGLLTEQRGHPGERLASTASRVGKVADVDLLKALSEQHGLPGIDLAQVVVPLCNLEIIPAEIARQHLILPILVKDDRVFLAMADPGDRRAVDEIEFVTGRRVFPYVALHEALSHVIDVAYGLAEAGEEYYIGAQVSAEYLASLGLSPELARSAGGSVKAAASAQSAGASEPPEPRPGSQAAVIAAGAHAGVTDELGIDELLDRRAEPAPARPSQAPRQKHERPRVLVVDDEDDIRKMLARVLEQKGYEVLQATKGLEALERVRDDMPDVILLDAMLPEVHGFDICRRIKGSKRYGHIPIIMVSALYRGWRVAEDLKSSYGVEAFLEKPFKIGDILALVAAALEGAKVETAGEDERLTEEASEALESGMKAYRDGDLEGAIAQLKRGLSIDPLSFSLHYHLGLLTGRTDNVFEAIHELETAVDLSPRHFSALKNLAVLYQRAGFKHKATEVWERALGAAPDQATRQGIKEHLMGLL